ncbi:MAG: glycoside hydrolase family 127 protein [Clostridiales bacterium]|nr:glycoside hydrolase family 127 protein [Clostridiales bacterium]
MRRFALEEVQMTEPRWTGKMALNAEFLEKMITYRVLAGFRRTAGIETDAEPYGGWEDSLIAGHGVGHYFSALAMRIAYLRGQVAALERITCEELDSARKELAVCTGKAETIVAGLSECQEKLGSGFLSAATVQDPGNVEIQFDAVEGRSDAQQWVPWYALHKVLQGLIDLWQYADIEGASVVAEKLAGWCCDRALSWDEETRKRVLSVEYGGMNDSLYQLFDITGDEKYRRAAKVFDEPELYHELLGFRNRLKGVHANATIPKIIGYLRGTGAFRKDVDPKKQEAGSGASEDAEARIELATRFFDLITAKQCYQTGGIGDMEHFFEDGLLDGSRTQCNAESCCAYNMIKLAQMLYERTGKIRFADYIERTLWNAKLGSVGPEGGYTYFNPMATGYYRLYSPNTPEKNPFWCCVGTGMEDFAKVADQVFYKDGDDVIIAQWISSNVRVSDHVRLFMNVDFDAGKLSVRHVVEDSPFSDEVTNIRILIPLWVANRKEILPDDGPYLPVKLKGNETITLDFEMKLSSHVLTDALPQLVTRKAPRIPNSIEPVPAAEVNRGPVPVGFTYGPFVLCVPLGSKLWGIAAGAGIDVVAPAWKVVFGTALRSDITYGKTQKSVLEEEYLILPKGVSLTRFRDELDSYITRNGDGNFMLSGLFNCKGYNVDLPLIPYYQTGDERYGIYWYLETDTCFVTGD